MNRVLRETLQHAPRAIWQYELLKRRNLLIRSRVEAPTSFCIDKDAGRPGLYRDTNIDRHSCIGLRPRVAAPEADIVAALTMHL